MQLKQIPIDQLHVSRLNMRKSRKTPDISDILPSIRERGVRQSLLVRKEGKKYGVVAGRRRLFALRKVAKETGKSLKAPCGILEAGDDAKAIEDSLLENIARLPADEFQQYDAFARLADVGKDVAGIAATFGVSELKVNRILALAGLVPEIKALYEAEEIQVPTLRALTMATPDQQKEWLALFHDEDKYEPLGDRLKAWLTGGANVTTDAALFDLADYDGVIVTDLFGDNAIFQDTDMFWQRQNKAIATRIEQYRKDGWSDVIILERGERFSSWDYGKRSKKEGGKVFVETRHDGQVTFHEGFLTKADIKKIDAILNGNTDEGAKPNNKPEMSGPLADYVRLHRHAIARATLLDHSALALRLAVAHMIAGSDLWGVRAHKPGARKEMTLARVAAASASKSFARERDALRQLLKLDGFSDDLASGSSGRDMLGVFARLMPLDDAVVLRILTAVMADSLSDCNGSVEAIGLITEIDVIDHWTPDDGFFDILRDKRVINAMVAEIAGDDTAAACLTDTGKSQKRIIQNRMDGVGADPCPDWRPRWMTFPATSYLENDDAEPALLSREAASVISDNQIAD